MKISKIIFLATVVFSTTLIKAQVVIGDPEPSKVALGKAILQMNNGNENTAKSFGIPVVELGSQLPFSNPASSTGYDPNPLYMGMLAFDKNQGRVMQFTGETWKNAFADNTAKSINVSRAKLAQEMNITCVAKICASQNLSWNFTNDDEVSKNLGFYADYLDIKTDDPTKMVAQTPGMYAVSLSIEANSKVNLLKERVFIEFLVNDKVMAIASGASTKLFGGNILIVQQFASYLKTGDVITCKLKMYGVGSDVALKATHKSTIMLEKVL